MSPTPGRSTLMTSAPNHASNCVQVGPDWTWVKSRIRTPFSAFVIVCTPSRIWSCGAGRKKGRGDCGPVRTGLKLFLLAQHALRIEVADAARLAAGGGIEHGVDQRRLA